MRKIVFLFLLIGTPVFVKSQVVIAPTAYFGIWGHNAFGHLNGTRNDFAAINVEASLEHNNLFIHPLLSLGYGFCKSNTPNNLNYFPLGAGLSFGKKRFRVKLEYYYTPIYGTYNYYYEDGTCVTYGHSWPCIYSKEYKFNYAQSFEILFSWRTKFGLYFHGGFAYKRMRSGFLPGVIDSSFLDDRYAFILALPSLGIGYTFGKHEKKNKSDNSSSPPTTNQ